ncbi:hypothetical protein [Marinagarivorans algicola]|uniref:hypothetical protein n=1 Tax=Marinagarivorans algicola TaxID=1513270 RepID=UPI0006B55939|nr:hypothetical protein [Marinagarivorans algicola]
MNTQKLSLSAIAILGIALAGCETTGAVVGASQKGLGALSCPEIYNTFKAYDKDKQSVDAAKQLSAAIGIPYTGNGTGFHDKAKTAANLALMAQGCNAL